MGVAYLIFIDTLRFCHNLAIVVRIFPFYYFYTRRTFDPPTHDRQSTIGIKSQIFESIATDRKFLD